MKLVFSIIVADATLLLESVINIYILFSKIIVQCQVGVLISLYFTDFYSKYLVMTLEVTSFGLKSI